MRGQKLSLRMDEESQGRFEAMETKLMQKLKKVKVVERDGGKADRKIELTVEDHPYRREICNLASADKKDIIR